MIVLSEENSLQLTGKDQIREIIEKITEETEECKQYFKYDIFYVKVSNNNI